MSGFYLIVLIFGGTQEALKRVELWRGEGTRMKQSVQGLLIAHLKGIDAPTKDM